MVPTITRITLMMKNLIEDKLNISRNVNIFKEQKILITKTDLNFIYKLTFVTSIF